MIIWLYSLKIKTMVCYVVWKDGCLVILVILYLKYSSAQMMWHAIIGYIMKVESCWWCWADNIPQEGIFSARGRFWNYGPLTYSPTTILKLHNAYVKIVNFWGPHKFLMYGFTATALHSSNWLLLCSYF